MHGEPDLQSCPNLDWKESTARVDTLLMRYWRWSGIAAWGVGAAAALIGLARHGSGVLAIFAFFVFSGIAHLGRFFVVAPMMMHHAESRAYSRHVQWTIVQVLLSPLLLFGPIPDWLKMAICAALMFNQLFAVRAVTGHARYYHTSYPGMDKQTVSVATVRETVDQYRTNEPFSPARTIGWTTLGFAITLVGIWISSRFGRDADYYEQPMTLDSLLGLAQMGALIVAANMARKRALLLDAIALVAHNPVRNATGNDGQAGNRTCSSG